jgi:threonine dehydrogenase-like Zn-dependent dehydrogenase
VSSEQARHFRVTVPGRGEIVAAPLPARQEHEILVRTRFTGISRGTEGLVFRGEVPASQHEAMRAPFQEGDFPGPVKYGYSSVGEVVDGPATLVGRTVFCLYPHQDRYVVPASAVTPLPEETPPARAVLAANMETAVNGVWDARPGPGDRVVVVGGGVVGCLVARLCGALPGARVTLVDPDTSRAPVAEALGVAWAPEPPADADADLVVHASGHPDGLVDALAAAGPGATVLELSWFGSRDVTLPLGEAFHSRRLTIRSSQVVRIPPDRTPRWTHARRMALALELLADPALDVLITGECAFDELPATMARLAADGAGTLCHRVRYD